MSSHSLRLDSRQRLALSTVSIPLSHQLPLVPLILRGCCLASSSHLKLSLILPYHAADPFSRYSFTRKVCRVRERNLDEMFGVFGEWTRLDVFLFEKTSEARESLLSPHCDRKTMLKIGWKEVDLVHAQESLRQELEPFPLAKIQRRRNR